MGIAAALLFVVSSISLTGFRIAFLAGTALAVLVLAGGLLYFHYFSLAASDSIIVLAIITIVVDLIASRPVFG